MRAGNAQLCATTALSHVEQQDPHALTGAIELARHLIGRKHDRLAAPEINEDAAVFDAGHPPNQQLTLVFNEVGEDFQPLGIPERLLHRLASLLRRDSSEVRRGDVDLKDLPKLHGFVVAAGFGQRDLVNVIGDDFDHGFVGVHSRIAGFRVNLNIDIVEVAVVVLKGRGDGCAQGINDRIDLNALLVGKLLQRQHEVTAHGIASSGRVDRFPPPGKGRTLARPWQTVRLSVV